MRTFNKIIEIIVFLVTTLFVIVLTYVLFEVYSYNNVFLEQQGDARVHFEKANEALLAEIPRPAGVQEVHRMSSSNGFGVWLTVSYQTMGLTRQETMDYYKQRLSERGFSSVGPYVRGTACISTNVSLEHDEFWVKFWYDYRKQTYSPRVPPNWLIYLVKYTETTGPLTCP